MRTAGLVSIETEGIGAFLSLCRWLTNKVLSYFDKILQRVVRLPRYIREKFGVNFVALSRKKQRLHGSEYMKIAMVVEYYGSLVAQRRRSRKISVFLPKKHGLK